MSAANRPVLRRLLWLAAAAVLLVVAALGVLLVVDWESPRLGAAALRKAGEVAGLELEATGFRLNLLRGLELREVRARGDLDAGRLEATMDRLVLEHRLLPLLSGRIVVDELLLERPTIHLLSPSAAAAAPASGAAGGGEAGAAGVALQEPSPEDAKAGGGLEVELSRIAIEDGSVTLESADEPAPLLDLHGLDVELRDLRLDPAAGAGLAGLTAAGELAADRAVINAIHGHDLTGGIRLAEGHLVLHDLDMPADLGHFRISALDLDLARDPIRFTLSLTGDPLTVGGLIGAAGEKLATARLELDTAGALGESFELDGRGKLSVAAGRLPDSAVIAAIDELLPGIDLARALHQPFEIDLRLLGDEVLVETFEVAVEEVRLALQGVIRLDETLDLRGLAKAPRELLAGSDVPDEVLDALTGDDGLVHLPIRMRGASDAPTASFDRSAWAAAARQHLRREAGRELRGRAAGVLGELLGGGSAAADDPPDQR